MGSFVGHLLPGSVFTLFGIWHVSNIYVRHFKCKLTNRRFFSSSTFPCFTTSFPVEPILKVVATTVGIFGEIKNGYMLLEKHIVIPENLHHVTMYFGFGLSGVVDCLVFYRVLWLPEKADYAMSAMAFVCEAILFALHQIPGNQFLENAVHTLLLYVIIATVAVVLVEIVAPRNFLLTLVRGTLLIIQGTWLVQVAFILYPPWNNEKSRWDATSHDSIMYSVVIFCFNLFGCLVITSMIGAVVRKLTVPRQFLSRAAERSRNNAAVGQAGNIPGLTNVDSDSDSSERELFVPTRAAHPP